MRQIPSAHESAPGGEPGIHDRPLPDSKIRLTRDRPHSFDAVRAGKTGIKVALVALVSCCAVGCVTQSTGTYDGAMTVTVENDVFTGSDNNYTNGIGATWSSNEINTYDDDRFVHEWAKFWSFLPFVGDDGYQTYAAWSVAQEMYTPDDIKVPNPPEDDQPYAGVLYLDNVLYARRDGTEHAWSLKVGVVGPASQAEDTQKWFHRVIGADKPKGWDTQLPNEPARQRGLLGRSSVGPRGCRQNRLMETRSVGHRGSRQLLHRCRSRDVRRGRLESGGCPGYIRASFGVQRRIDGRCRASEWLVRCIYRRSRRLRRCILASA